MLRKLKFAAAIVAAAGLAVSVMAQVDMQTVRDRAEGNRLIINGQPLFLSGMNIAWSHGNAFGSEVGDASFDANAFGTHIKNIRAAGGNSVRWWLHTDASNCPKIDSDGKVTRLGSKTIDNIKTALDIAEENGVAVILCLFSFDLLVPGDGGKGDTYYPDYNLENNHKFLTDTANVTTYIENALNPMLEALGDHPAIAAWEVFNEPEGMLQAEGWSHVLRKISFDDILRITNRIAGAVRRHPNSLRMVSTGIKDFSYLQAGNSRGYYSDENLIAAGGDEDGWLDFYMGHYYPQWQGVSISPFHNPASHWNADRPILVGEFPARDWPSGYTVQQGTDMGIVDAFEYAFNNGYAGALSWSMTEANVAHFGNFETTRPALEKLFEEHKDVIMIKDVEYEDLTGQDLVMRLAINNLPVATADWAELGTALSSVDFSGATNLTFDLLIANGSGTNLDINVVVKTGGSYTWTPGPTLKLEDYTVGSWQKVTVNVADFDGSGLNDVRELLFQFGSTATPFTGTIFIDSVKLDNTVISDFDDERAWSVAMRHPDMSSTNAGVSIVTRESVGGSTSVLNGKTVRTVTRAPAVSVRGRTLNICGADNAAEMSVRLVNMRGRTVARFKASGSAQFSLNKVPAGRYIVETKVANKRVGTTAVIVK